MSTTRAGRWTLTVSIFGSSLAFVDASVVNVALPNIQRDIGASVDHLQWIVEAYALLLSSLVLVGGALGDRFGRRRVFLAGVVVFALASIGCAAAPNANVLIAARAVQGFGAALLTPGSLALISAAFQDEKDRASAFGKWSAASALMGALGPVLGGWIVTHASWRWIFLLNIPVAVAVVLLALAGVEESRDESAPRSMDWTGAALATLGLGLIVYALVSSEKLGGMTSHTVMLLLAFGVVALGAFVVVEAHVRSPMVPLALFRSPTFSGLNVLTLFLYTGLGGTFFFLPFLLIQVHGYSPAKTGAALVPLVLLIASISQSTGALVTRFGVRRLLTIGPFTAAVGFAVFALPTAAPGSYWTTFFPAVMVLGIGMGLTVAPLTTAVMGAVDTHHAGVASGISNAIARTAGLLAVAALGVLVVWRFNAILDERLAAMTLSANVLDAITHERSKLAGAEFPSWFDDATAQRVRAAINEAFVEAFRAATLTSAGLAALGALAALLTVELQSNRAQR